MSEVIKKSPALFFTLVLSFLLSSITAALTIPALNKLFDEIRLLPGNYSRFPSVLLALFLILFFNSLEKIGVSLANYKGECCDLSSYEGFASNIYKKLGKLSVHNFEDSKFHDSIEKAFRGIWSAINFSNVFVDMFIYYIPYFIVMGIYLIRLKPVLLLIMFFIFLSIILGQILKVRAYSKFEEQAANLSRKLYYYEDCMVEKRFFKETRLLGGFTFFRSLFKDSMKLYKKLKWKTDAKAVLFELASRMIALLTYLGVILIIVYYTYQKEISIGAFAAILLSIDDIFSTMEEFLCHRIGSYAENFGKVENYLNFISMEIKEEEAVDYGLPDAPQDINLNEVSYRYPESNNNVVENINLQIKAGERIAIVGENGSGKSTLVKLIMGLIPPNAGTISYGNQQLRYGNNQHFLGQSAIFQDYAKYKIKLYENVTISKDLNGKFETEQQTVENCLSDAGFILSPDHFTEGYHTILSTEFGGIELSEGQHQRIATARGIYRDSHQFILDEPTSAIDPNEELSMYQRFNQLTKGKTTLIVTHRLGMVKVIDKIVVMHQGKILGYDTHKNLLHSLPYYREMWESQLLS